MHDTRVLTIGAAGTGAKAWVLQGGYQVAGIKIDNKSGSWLVLPDGAFCPPYTLAWGHSFQPTLASIDVLFSTGPASQVSTQQGDKPIVTIYSDPVGESPGIPSGQGKGFIEDFTPNQTVTHLETVIIGDASGFEILPSVAGKRYRIVAYSFTMDSILSHPEVSGCLVSITSNDFNQNPLIYDHVGPRPENYGTGVQIVNMDFPVGVGVTVTMEADWSDVDCTVTLIYQLI